MRNVYHVVQLIETDDEGLVGVKVIKIKDVTALMDLGNIEKDEEDEG